MTWGTRQGVVAETRPTVDPLAVDQASIYTILGTPESSLSVDKAEVFVLLGTNELSLSVDSATLYAIIEE